MTTFSQPLSNTGPIKLLYLGNTSVGKTGSTLALAAMGYEIFNLSTDGVPEIYSDYLFNSKSIYINERPGLWTKEQAATINSRVHFESVPEGYNIIGGKAVPKGDSWQKITQLLNNWIDSETKEKFGPISNWDSNRILIIDSFTRLQLAMMNFQLAMNGRLASGPQVGNFESNDWAITYIRVEEFLDMLKCAEIKCNVILICHIDYVDVAVKQSKDDKTVDIRGFPQTLGSGRKLGPRVGQYFNHALLARQTGTYPMVKREILTNTADYVALKATSPLKVKSSYPLETGLAEYFLAVRGPLNADAK